MASYSLLYFNGRGRAEIIRLLFTLKGQDFEDKRVTHETWPAEKPNTPFGQMPVLTIDGKVYTESLAIAKFLAKEFGFYGSTNQEEYEIDQITGMCNDLFTEMVREFRIKKRSAVCGEYHGTSCTNKQLPDFSEDDKPVVTFEANMTQNLKEKTKPRFVGNLEKILSAKGKGYCIGDTLSLGDLVLYDTLDGRVADDIIDKYPNVKAVMNNVRSNDRIKAYLAARVPTPM